MRRAMGNSGGWGVPLAEFVWIIPPPLALIPLFSVEPPRDADSDGFEEASDKPGKGS